MPNRIEIDRNELELVIQLLEEDGPFGSLNALYKAVVETMEIDVTPQCIRARIAEWEIPIKTQPGRQGRKRTEPEEEEDFVDEYHAMRSRMVVYTPSGKCPYKLIRTDRESVKHWADAVVEFGLERGLRYTSDALKYFARQFYDIFSEDYATIKSHITDTKR